MMRLTKRQYILITCWVLAVLTGFGIMSYYLVFDSMAQTTYSYESEILITNTSDVDAYSDRVLITTNGLALVNGGYIQADGDDVAVVMNGVAEEIVVKDLNVNDGVWVLDYTDINPSSTVKKYMSMGNRTVTRDQVWIGSDEDCTYIPDDATLDQSGGAFMVAATVDPIRAPTSESGDGEIIEKPGNYSLRYDGTDYIWEIWELGSYPVSPGSEVLVPDRLISGTGAYTVVGGTLPGVLSDGNNATHIDNISGHSYLWFGLSDPAAPEGYNVGTVTIYITARRTAAGGSVASGVGMHGYSDTDTLYSPYETYTTYDSVFSSPNCCPWTVDDLYDLQLWLHLYENSFISEAWANIEYYGVAPGTSHQVSITATNNEVDLMAWWDGSRMIIQDGVSQSTSGTLTIVALHTNNQNVYVGEIDAYVNDAYLAEP